MNTNILGTLFNPVHIPSFLSSFTPSLPRSLPLFLSPSSFFPPFHPYLPPETRFERPVCSERSLFLPCAWWSTRQLGWRPENLQKAGTMWLLADD